MTLVCSWTRTPRRSTAAASPRTRRAGCRAAQSGVYVAPRVPVARSTLSASPAPSSRRSSLPRPHVPADDTSSRARRSWARLRARLIVPPLAKSASMPSARGDAGDLVDGLAHGPVLCQRSLAVGAGQRGQRRQRRGEERRAPPAVATGGAEAGHLGLQHHDPQGRIGLGEIVRRPQSGEACSDDGHVRVGVPRQRIPGRPGVAGGLVPQAEAGVARSGQRTPHE